MELKQLSHDEVSRFKRFFSDLEMRAEMFRGLDFCQEEEKFNLEKKMKSDEETRRVRDRERGREREKIREKTIFSLLQF